MAAGVFAAAHDAKVWTARDRRAEARDLRRGLRLVDPLAPRSAVRTVPARTGENSRVAARALRPVESSHTGSGAGERRTRLLTSARLGNGAHSRDETIDVVFRRIASAPRAYESVASVAEPLHDRRRIEVPVRGEDGAFRQLPDDGLRGSALECEAHGRRARRIGRHAEKAHAGDR